MGLEDNEGRLAAWLVTQLPGATALRIEGFDPVGMGHSAEIAVLTLAWEVGGSAHRREVVLRVRPAPPGLLEPYDMVRQFEILRALEGTDVRAPRALWVEQTGEVLGRPFFVMERVEGVVYERSVPPDLEGDPERLRRMSEAIVEQIAAIHAVDIRATGLDRVAGIGDGRGYLARELDRWEGEIRRLQRGPLPALERLVAELRARQPEQHPKVTLVHGDPKPGNFAFLGDRVNAVFDWEMATLGDPMADIGWAEIGWAFPNSITNRPGALNRDEFVARYEQLTGIAVQHREWYRAFQGMKTAVICFVAAMLYDRAESDDARFAAMGLAVAPFTQAALRELGIADALEPGPVTATRAPFDRLEPAVSAAAEEASGSGAGVGAVSTGDGARDDGGVVADRVL